MDSTPHYCKHEKIQRNCYSCFINGDFTVDVDKTPLDTLHEAISELKVRIAKLEEYKRLQDDYNKDLSKNIFDLNEFKLRQIGDNHLIYARFSELDEHRKKQIDENRAVSKHLDDLDGWRHALDNDLGSAHEKIMKLEDSPFAKSVTYEPLFERLRELEVRLQIKESAEKWKHYCEENNINYKWDMGVQDRTEVRYVGSVAVPHAVIGMSFDDAFLAFMRGKAIKRKGGSTFCLVNPDGHTFTPNEILAKDWEIVE